MGVGYIVYSRIGPKADFMLGHAFCSAEERIAPRADLPAFVRLYFGAVWHGGYWVQGLENLLPLLNFLFLNSLTYEVKET